MAPNMEFEARQATNKYFDQKRIPKYIYFSDFRLDCHKYSLLVYFDGCLSHKRQFSKQALLGLIL